MGTAATPTKVHMSDAVGGVYRGIFTLLLDTTDTDGTMSIDLTDYFDYVYGVNLLGSLDSHGYHIDVQKPAYDTALSSTNLLLGFYEAGADGAVLDLVASTDMSALVTGLTIEVIGKQAV